MSPTLSARTVVRAALVTYRRHFALLAGISLVVFSVLAVGESLVEVLLEQRIDRGDATFVDAGLWLVTGLWTFGSALFGGLCETIVGAELGRREPPLRVAWRRLPYGRLIALDVVVTALVTVGMALLVVPGVVLFTLTCIAAPLMVIEGLGVRAAMVRSARLVRPRFALALGIVTIPVLLEHEVVHAIEAVTGLAFIALLVVNFAGIILVITPVSLVEAVLAYGLLGRSIEPVAESPGSVV